jgi:hypothetical protein
VDWRRIKELWDRKLARRELQREAAEGEGAHPPHTGGALFDEPYQPTETVPGDDLPDGPPGS